MVIRALKGLDAGIALAEKVAAGLALLAILLLVSWQVPVRLMAVETRKGIAQALGGLGGALFDDYTWMTPVARFLLLWATFLGASLAARSRRHILIDVVTKSIPSKRVQAAVNVPSTLLAAAITGYLAYVAAGVVRGDWHDASILRGLTRGWIELIVPISLGVMAFRFVLAALEDGRGALTGDLAYLAAYEPEVKHAHLEEPPSDAAPAEGAKAAPATSEAPPPEGDAPAKEAAP